MRHLLVSAYRCDPEGVSEAHAAYRWLRLLAAHYEITLATPERNCRRVEAALQSDPSIDASRVHVLPVPCADLSRLGFVEAAMKPGFFLYDRALFRLLSNRPELLDGIDATMHRNPMSLRFPSSLWRLPLPFMIGPIGGGLRPPRALRRYFKRERSLYKLRELDPFILPRPFFRRQLRNAGLILIVADYVRSLLPRDLGPKMRVLFDIGADLPLAPPEREGFDVLYVGRMTRYKGPTLAVKAFAEFRDRVGPDAGVTFTMVGDGEERRECEDIVRKHDLSSAVTITRWLPREEISSFYERASILLFPSILEAAGHVYVEAMSHGCAVVGVDSGGGGAVIDSSCGVKVPVTDEESLVSGLADALEALYADPEQLARLQAGAREKVAAQYSWESLGSQLQTLIDDFLATG